MVFGSSIGPRNIAGSRIVFGRPIGMNQGVQFPLAKAYANILAASHVRWRAVDLFESGRECGSEATTAKMLSSLAQWEAGMQLWTPSGAME